MFQVINEVLFYNNNPVHHNGETLEGNFIALIFSNSDDYCYMIPLDESIEDAIKDYSECTGLKNFDVEIRNINF